MHPEFVRHLLLRAPLRQAHQRLRTPPHARMGMPHAHLHQGAPRFFVQLKPFHFDKLLSLP
jgi:hypothetical protein